MREQTMSTDLLQTRAMFAPDTVNVDERTVDVVWTTGAQVKRSDWARGDYIEELSLSPDAVRLDRLNRGAPLLDSHENFSLRSVLGVVERAWLNGNEGRATVRFSKRAEVEPIFQDVRDGILRNISVGYRKHKTERDESGTTPVERAVDWEPYELSLVPIPADAAAQVRSEESPNMNPETALTQDSPMDETRMQEAPAEARGAEAAVTTETQVDTRAAAPAVDVEAVRAGERRRVTDIMDACRKAGFTGDFAEKLIADGTPIDGARAAIIDAMYQRQQSQPQTQARIDVTADHGEKRAEAMLHALEARSGFRKWDEGGAREYLGTTLLDMARECVERSGVSTKGMTKDELAGRAMHSTTDFPLLLTSIQRVTLKAAYAEERQTWQPLARQDNLPDFRDMSVMEVGGQILPEELREGGEYKAGTISETKGSWKLSEYGKKLVVGRRLIINDNLGYITRAIQVLGRGVAVFEANQMWGLITTGSLGATCMMDSKALFHADHANTGTGVIGEASISDARQKMRNQKSFDGTPLYVTPQYILIPTTLETAFDKFNTTIVPNQISNVNIFSGYLQKIVEPRLDAKSTTQFYVVGDYPGVDKLVYGYLDGEGGPSIESVSGRDPDGVTVYLRHSFGCTVPQHQWIYRSTGA
jgi:hypothetical protein